MIKYIDIMINPCEVSLRFNIFIANEVRSVDLSEEERTLLNI